MVYCLLLCIYFLWWWSFFAYSVQKIKQNERFFYSWVHERDFSYAGRESERANSVKRRKIVSNWDLRPFQFSFSLVKWIFLIWQSRLGSNLKRKICLTRTTFEIILRLCVLAAFTLGQILGTNGLMLSRSFPLVWRRRQFRGMSDCRAVMHNKSLISLRTS